MRATGRTEQAVGMLLMLALWTTGCDSPPPVPAAAEPPPAEIQFPTQATHARYMYFDEDARPVVVAKRSDVPDFMVELASVLLAERTTAPEGELYGLVPSASDDRVSVARLVKRETLEQASTAAWTATYLALDVDASAGVVAALAEIAVPKKSKGRKPSSKPQAAAPPTIEIVSISGDSADRPRSRGAAQPSGGRQWKPVTLYYVTTCGWCRRAMKWMDANQVSYTKRDVDDDRVAMEWSQALRRAGRTSGGVPTFVIGHDRQVMQGWNEERFIELAAR